MKLIEIIFKNPIHISKEMQHISITKIGWLTLFRRVNTVYSESCVTHKNTLCGQNAELSDFKAGSTCSKHCALKCYSTVWHYFQLTFSLLETILLSRR